jgi:hypothetical protein
MLVVGVCFFWSTGASLGACPAARSAPRRPTRRDVQGRAKAYECIVKGKNLPEPGIPESFNVLLNELQGLGLNIDLD